MNKQHSSKWVQKIIDLQHADGSWGHFHTLSAPTKTQPITTEQALRRLRILGLTKDDEPIGQAIQYMTEQLKKPYPTVFHEKKHDSKTYGDLMLATWIRLFDTENESALTIANQWANIIHVAFQSGVYFNESYVKAYESEFGKLNPKAGCLANFVIFYQLSLLPGLLNKETEKAMMDYVLSYPQGIGYIHHEPLNILPPDFSSKKASRYLAAIEILSAYNSAPDSLQFVSDWLFSNQGADGMWDMGASAKDGIYFPLSDSWRNPNDRKSDCTYRIRKLLVQGFLN